MTAQRGTRWTSTPGGFIEQHILSGLQDGVHNDKSGNDTANRIIQGLQSQLVG